MGQSFRCTGIERVETLGDATLLFVRFRKTSLETPILTVLIDQEDTERVLSLDATMLIDDMRNGYYASLQINTEVGQERISLHRFINQPGPGQVVDHTYGNTLDNRKRFLRNVTRLMNRSNQTVARKGSKSGLLGVKQTGGSQRWLASFCFKGCDYDFGYFDERERAGEAYVVGRERVCSGEIGPDSVFVRGNRRLFASRAARLFPDNKALPRMITHLTIFDPMPDCLGHLSGPASTVVHDHFGRSIGLF